MAKTVLLAVDLNAPAQNAATLAAALGLLDGGTLHAVSVMPDFGLPSVGAYFRQDFEKEALAAFGRSLAEWVEGNVPADVSVRPHVLHGTIYDEILRAAERVSADVIVIGAHRPELSDYLLGPNAARVVRHARCSVYVVRD